jgi:DNA-binding transcriptional ArsR family regulator
MPNHRMQPEDVVPEHQAEQIADTMFALSSPTRVRLLGCLLTAPHSVSELVAATGIEQSGVSHQLRVLREHGLVSVQRDGRRRVYTIADEHVASLLDAARMHALRRSGREPRSRIARMLHPAT